MTSLSVIRLNDSVTMPKMSGVAIQIPVMDAQIHVTLRTNEKPGKAYLLHTGLAFDVPDGHVLKLYTAPSLARDHLARLAEGVAVVLPGDKNEVILRLVVDNGGKSFEPQPGMIVAHGMLEAVTIPTLIDGNSDVEPVKAATPMKYVKRTQKAQ